MAHELAHVKNRDTLIMTMTATIAGAISMLANFGLMFGGGSDRNNPLGAIGTILMVILAPLGRHAGADGDQPHARIWRRPRRRGDLRPAAWRSPRRWPRSPAPPIASRTDRRKPIRRRRTCSSSIRLSGARMDNLFSTHPDPKNRIDALMAMARATGGDRSSADSGPWSGTPSERQGPWG